MPKTYDPISTTTLSTTASDVTFSGIPGTFTDLNMVVSTQSTGPLILAMQLNGDAAANYSYTRLTGNGSAAQSFRLSGVSEIQMALAFNPNDPVRAIIDLMSYSNTSINKNFLIRSSSPANVVFRNVGRWNSTSAITSIKLIAMSYNATPAPFNAGSTFSLYGIKAA